MQSNFIEIPVRHVCSPVNLLHLFRTTFSKNTYGGPFLPLIAPVIAIGHITQYEFNHLLEEFLESLRRI